MGTRSITVRKDLPRAVRRRRRLLRNFRQAVGVALVFFLSYVGHPTNALLAVGTAFACAGMLVRLWASGFVMKNEVLATTGPYGHVRHPLYVGNFLICIGFCFASGLWWSVSVSIAYLLVFYPETIRHEDQRLRRNFTEAWDAWAAETRALIPRLKPFSESQDGTSWSFGRSLMRNGEPIHIAVLGGCLVYLYLERLV